LHLHVVGRAPTTADAAQPATAAAAPPARSAERALLDQWREAHWTLRLRLQEVARDRAHRDIERLYDSARRADNLLTEFYQLRADHLARKLRATLMTARPGADGHAPGGDSVNAEERVLLAYFRALGAADRSSLLRQAARLGDDAAERSLTPRRRPTT
jgi:hypothetical protein